MASPCGWASTPWRPTRDGGFSMQRPSSSTNRAFVQRALMRSSRRRVSPRRPSTVTSPPRTRSSSRWLRQPETRWFNQVRLEVEARAALAAERLLTIFDVVGEWLAESDFRGSPFMNVLAELTESDHPARREALAYELEICEYLRRTAVEAGIARPASHAEQLHILINGAMALAVATRSLEPVRVARDAATRLRTVAQST